MHLTHLVIDDFFSDPHEIRRQALQLDYPRRDPTAIYPGRNAARPLSLPGIESLIGQIVHERLAPQPGTSHSIPRIAMSGETSKASIHIDMNHWSVMAYLSLDEHCEGGTHFYRHRQTGWEMAPAFPGMAEKAGYESPDAALNDILKSGGYDHDAWELRMTIPMKFNRVAIFRGYMWHDAGHSFGTTPENARLVLPFFFDNIDQK